MMKCCRGRFLERHVARNGSLEGRIVWHCPECGFTYLEEDEE